MSSRRHSDIWYHFSRHPGIKKKAKCLLCQATLSIAGGSTGNLSRHMKLKHPTIPQRRDSKRSRSRSPTTTIEETDKQVRRISSTSIAQPEHNSTHENLPSTSHSVSLQSPSTSLSNSWQSNKDSRIIESTHLSMSSFIARPVPLNKSRSIDIQLTKMICKEIHPFNLVDEPEFKKFVKMLCPGYFLPCRKTISNSLLPSLYKATMKKIKFKILDAPAICLTCDNWTSLKNTSFYSVTAHYIDQNSILHSNLLECREFPKKHTEVDISDWLDKVTKSWKINHKLSAVVTDNAAIIKAAVHNLSIKHISCFAHNINLIVQAAIENSIKDIVNKIKSIVEYFKQSRVAKVNLHETQKNMNMEQLKLKQHVVTRWNSTFEMLERVNKNKNPLISTLALLKCKESFSILPQEWNIMENAVRMLSVFQDVTNEISSDKTVSLSKTCVLVRVMVGRTKANLKNKELPEKIVTLGKELLNGLNERFGDRETIDIIAETVFLDPRFKKQGFKEDRNYKNTYNALAEKIRSRNVSTSAKLENPQNSSSSLWDEFDAAVEKLYAVSDPTESAIVELEKYVTEPLLIRSANPLLWWNERKTIYPNLYEIAIKRLCIPATSVPCERIFSKAGQIMNDKRMRLTSSKASEILFINSNLDDV